MRVCVESVLGAVSVEHLDVGSAGVVRSACCLPALSVPVLAVEPRCVLSSPLPRPTPPSAAQRVHTLFEAERRHSFSSTHTHALHATISNSSSGGGGGGVERQEAVKHRAPPRQVMPLLLMSASADSSPPPLSS